MANGPASMIASATFSEASPLSSIDVRSMNSQGSEFSGDGQLVVDAQSIWDMSFKVSVMGDSGVGKTMLLNKELGFFPNQSSTLPTPGSIGIQFHTKCYDVEDRRFQVQFWDTTGSESHRKMTARFGAGAAAIVFIYDVTSQVSFDSLNVWISDVTNGSTSERGRVICIIGNMVDSGTRRVVSSEVGAALAESFGADYYETSAATGEGVTDTFQAVIAKVAKNVPSIADASQMFNKNIRLHAKYHTRNYEYTRLLYQLQPHPNSIATSTADWIV